MSVIRLYPQLESRTDESRTGSRETILPLSGLYLSLALHNQAGAGDVLIYANFICSLDGRIAVRNSTTGQLEVPAAIANPRDWRLYQELAAQSDIMLTSARYFRQLAEGCAQDLLPVGHDPAYADLLAWREAAGLKPQPDVAVLSKSLDIPLAALERLAGRRLVVFTDEDAADDRVQALERQGVSVIAAGERGVDGLALKRQLIEQGYRSAYMIAGPGVFHTLVRAGVMNRLFLTTRHLLLGGSDAQTLFADELSKPAELSLASLYLDVSDEPGQSFAQFVWPRV